MIKEKLSGLLKHKNAPKILVAAGVLGIVLIFASTLVPEEETAAPEQVQSDFDREAYKAGLEESVKQIVAAISGDTDAVVTVTLESGVVYEYAKQIKDSDAADESSSSKESERNYVTVKDSSGAETPLLITAYMPEVRGVAIICAADTAAAEKIKDAVVAALDINTRQIYIGRKIN